MVNTSMETDPGEGQGGAPTGGLPSEGVIGVSDVGAHSSALKPVIVDGLLCNIIRSLSNTTKDEELVAAIGSEILEPEVKAAWFKLFTFYKDVLDDQRKIPVIEIRRQTVKMMIEDIIRCLRKKDAVHDLEVFVHPWYYPVGSFVTDSQKVDNAWQKVTLEEADKRANDLEKH